VKPATARQRTKVARRAPASWTLRPRFVAGAEVYGFVEEAVMSTEAAQNPASRTAVQQLAQRLLVAERLLMGLVFVALGVAGVLDLLPHASGDAGAAALGAHAMKAGFLFPLLKGTEVLLELYLGFAGRKA
jgi:hypothetical protein